MSDHTKQYTVARWKNAGYIYDIVGRFTAKRGAFITFTVTEISTISMLKFTVVKVTK